MATQPETNFKRRVFKRLSLLSGCWYFKVVAGSVVGIPDVIGLYKGKFFAWELKSKKGSASKIQLLTLLKIKEAGGIARTVYPDELEESISELIQKA